MGGGRGGGGGGDTRWGFPQQRSQTTTSCAKHPTYCAKHPTSRAKHPTRRAKLPNLEAKHLTFRAKHQNFEVKALDSLEQLFQKIEGLGIDLGGSESVCLHRFEVYPPCSRGICGVCAQRGPNTPLRRLGPYPPPTWGESRPVANPACAPSDKGGGVLDFQIFETRCWKKVLREPGSNRPKICRRWKARETIGIDSGGPA